MKIYSVKKIFLIIFVLILRLISAFRVSKNKERAIVIFSTGKLGDLVCLTPVFKALKDYNPKGQLIVYIGKRFVDILANNPYLDHQVGFSSTQEAGNFFWIFKQWRWLSSFKIDYYFNLVNNFEGSLLGVSLPVQERHQVSIYLDGWSQKLLYPFYKTKKYEFDREIKQFYFDILESAGIEVKEKKNQLFFDTPPSEIEAFFSQHKTLNKTVIGVIIESGKDYKSWPISHWHELFSLLEERYHPVILLFAMNRDWGLVKSLQVTGLNLIEVIGKPLNILPYYLKKCDLFIGVDTGLIYISDALNIPVIDILGPCDEKTQKPENNYRLVTNRQFCQPCCKVLDNFFINEAEIKVCFESITPEQVIVACGELLPLPRPLSPEPQ